MNWYLQVLKKYVVFGGRAQRKEYWYFVLFNIIIQFILLAIDNKIAGFNTLAVPGSVGLLGAIYSLVILLPALAVLVRRLHDAGRSAWWLLIGLLPIIGAIVLFIFTVQDSTPGENEYGPNPKEAASS